MRPKSVLTLVSFLIFFVFGIAACGPNEEELDAQIAAVVEQTAAAIPTASPFPTQTPFPPESTATPYPTQVPLPLLPTSTLQPTQEPEKTDIEELYCSYDFCIGHPPETVLVDRDAPEEWSSYEDGYLIGSSLDHLMLLWWYDVPKSIWQPEDRVTNLALDSEELQGELVTETIGNTEVTYGLYLDQEPDSVLKTAVNFAFYCGDRGFLSAIAIAYEGDVVEVMKDSLEPFVCSQK